MQPTPSEGSGGATPNVDPVTGQVMTKRAIRRRIVKNWERKQKELRASAALHECDGDPQQALADPTIHRTTPPPLASGGKNHTRAQHPLRIAARTSQGLGSLAGNSNSTSPQPLPERDPRTAFLNGGLAVPGIPPPFEFFFRAPPSAVREGRALSDLDGAPTSMRFEDHQDDGEQLQQASRCAVVDESFMAMVTRSAHHTDRSCEDDDPSSGAVERPSAVLPIPSAFSPPTSTPGSAGAGPPAFRPVIRRVERQEPMPLAPFAPGTDLNTPTQNYLSLDALWGVHRHAPGFYRESDAATTTLLTAAARVLADDGRAVNVISTGDAMTRLFESSYRQDQPFTLHVHRIGPAVVLRAPSDSSPEHTIEQVRKKALMSKALYRIRDAVGRGDPSGGVPPSTSNAEAAAAAAAAAASALAVRGDAPRAGSLTFANRVQQDPNLHAYSNVLQWGIHQSLEVLIGMDTPVLVDREHDNMELTLALHDAMSGSELTSPSSVHLDALRCWFESTLANVAHVGFCVHNRGVVQSYQLKKVTELLTMVEAQVATSAMGFTTSALKWLMENCVDDGTDYAVIRNSDTNMLELYALHGSVPHYPDEEDDDGEDQPQAAIPGRTAATSSPTATSGSPRTSADGVGAGGSTRRESCANGVAPDMTLAVLCYKMGVHLSLNGKSMDALRLFFRSFQIFHLHAEERESAVAPLVDICSRLGKLMEAVLAERLPAAQVAMRSHGGTAAPAPDPSSDGSAPTENAPNASHANASDRRSASDNTQHRPQSNDKADGQGGGGSSNSSTVVSTLLEIPEMFQEVLFTCMRMEDRARQMYETVVARSRRRREAWDEGVASAAFNEDEGDGPLTMAATANMLLRCGAAVSIVVGKCLDWWAVLRQRLRVLKRNVVHRQRDSVVQLHTIAYKELIQVALEGIATLEGVSRCFFPNIDPLNPQQMHAPAASLLASREVDRRDGVKTVDSDGGGAAAGASTAVALLSGDIRGTLMVEFTHLSLAICELMGDVHFNAAADASPTTATSIGEISGCMLRRQHRQVAATEAPAPRPRNSGPADVRHGDTTSTTCLRRLAQATPDVVVHFHEAMRYYAKQKTVTRRLTAKIARLYFTVGVHYRDTDRWTKALENLRLCEDVLATVSVAPCDAIYAACTQQCVLHVSDVKAALGSVLLQMAMSRREQALQGQASVGGRPARRLFVPANECMLLNAVPMRYDEEKLWSGSIEAFNAAVECTTHSSGDTCDDGDEDDTGAMDSDAEKIASRCVAHALYAIRCTQHLTLRMLAGGASAPGSGCEGNGGAVARLVKDADAHDADECTATLEHIHAVLRRNDVSASRLNGRHDAVSMQRWLCLAQAQLVSSASMLASAATIPARRRLRWSSSWSQRATECVFRAKRLGFFVPYDAVVGPSHSGARSSRCSIVPPSSLELAVQLMIMASGAVCVASTGHEATEQGAEDYQPGCEGATPWQSSGHEAMLLAAVFEAIGATASGIDGQPAECQAVLDVLLYVLKSCIRWATQSGGASAAFASGLKGLLREAFVFRHNTRSHGPEPLSPQEQAATIALIRSIGARSVELHSAHARTIAP